MINVCSEIQELINFLFTPEMKKDFKESIINEIVSSEHVAMYHTCKQYGMSDENIKKAISEHTKKAFTEINLKAFDLGFNAAAS